MSWVWQVDFYRRPLRDKDGRVLWELLICDGKGWQYEAWCPQSQVSSDWLIQQLRLAAGVRLPDLIQVFRPQSLSLVTVAGEQLGIPVEPSRFTLDLKQWLQERAPLYARMDGYTGEQYNLLAVEKPPPMPLPEQLWGERWRFATLKAGEVEAAFAERPIPILEMPDFLLPLNLGLASTASVPGVVIDGGRQSMRLARWLQAVRPVALNYVAGSPSGLILEAGLVERWIVATFTDPDVLTAALLYEQRKQLCRRLHFLLVQPDDSGITYSGFWLLRGEEN